MRARHGFSLVELSIVLVILGLLAGGILGGQALIRSSELKAGASEFQRYASAFVLFTDKFNAVPGDMANATKYWGVNVNSTACQTTASATQATCDGTGDGAIDEAAVNPSVTNWERFSAWKHLSNAGMIDAGGFTGVAGPDSVRDVVIGTNSPRSRISGAGWSVAARVNGPPDVNWYPTGGTNFLLLGGETGTTANWGLVLKPEDAWNIDKKVDDGRPGFGTVYSLKPSPSTIMPNCATSADEAVALYNLANNQPACALIQILPI